MKMLLRNKTKILTAIALGLLLYTLFGNFWINYRDYLFGYFDHDGSAEIMLAKTMAENGEWVFSQNWFYSSEIRFLHNQLLMSLLFRFTSDYLLVHLLSSLVLGIFMAGAALYCFRSATLPWWKAILAACIPISAFSGEWFNNVLANCYYSFFIANTFLFIGMFLRYTRKDLPRKKILLAGLMCVFAFLMGMCGMRYAILVFLPLLAVTAYEFLPLVQQKLRDVYAKKQTLRGSFANGPANWFAIMVLASLFFAVGFAIYNLVLTQRFNVYNTDRFVFAAVNNIPDKFMYATGALVRLFFPAYGLPVLSVSGLLQFAKLLYFGTAVLCSVLLWRQRKSLQVPIRLFVTVAWAIFFINIFACLFLETPFDQSTVVSDRYLILAVFALAPSPAIYLCTPSADVVKRGLCALLAAGVLLVNPVALHHLIQKDPNYAGTTAVHNQSLFPALDTLMEQGYTSGYTDFHFNGIANLYSEGKLEVAAVQPNNNGMQLSPWLQPKAMKEIPAKDDKQFLVLFKFKYDEFAPFIAENPNFLYDDGLIFVVEIRGDEIPNW